MKHPTLEDFAGFFSTYPEVAEVYGRHLAAVCPACGELLEQMEALLKRFRHWDPAIVVGEGLEADDLLDALLAKGQDFASWWPEVEKRGELLSWGVAWVALERASPLLVEETARPRARELALLAAAISENLGSCYHVEWINDLKALAYATVVAAADPAGTSREAAQSRLRHTLAATEALEKGTGSESLATEVWELLMQNGQHL
ncbi:MAG TPA: hypothetical protein VGK45_08240 [Thermoanaerobaculia bacterium]